MTISQGCSSYGKPLTKKFYHRVLNSISDHQILLLYDIPKVLSSINLKKSSRNKSLGYSY